MENLREEGRSSVEQPIEFRPREVQVLQGAADGKSTPQIAEELGISKPYVKNIKADIVQKAGKIFDSDDSEHGDRVLMFAISNTIRMGIISNTHGLDYRNFTSTEEIIAQMLCEGKGRNEIKDVLWLSEKTIKKYSSNILEKLGVRTMFAACAKYTAIQMTREAGQLPPPMV